MSRFKRYFWASVVFALVLFCVTSCNGNTDDMSDTARFLTDVFTSEKFSVSDNFRMNYDVIPYYDAETETLTILSVHITENDDGKRDISARLTDFRLDGKAVNVTPLSLSENYGYVGNGAVTKDYLYYSSSRRENEFGDTFVTELFRFDRNTGETISTSAAFDGDFALRCIATDKNDLIYCTDYNTVHVFNPDLSVAFSYNFPQTVYTMARGADGSVWVTFNAGMESCAAIIDPTEKSLGTYYSFTRAADSLEQTLHYLIDAAVFGDERGFFYCDMQNAIWKATVTEDGTLSEEKYMDLYNSGISRLRAYSDSVIGAVGIYPSVILSDDLFLVTQYENTYYSCPVLYTRAEDIDLSEITTVTIAYAYALNAEDVEKITRFNAEHPDITVVLEDYGKYATDDDRLAGEEKLCFDMLNGFVRPDIVISQAYSKTLSDRTVAVQLTKNNLYTDLTPYLEKDDTVNFDTLFGCIPRMFDDGNGGIWGISTSFMYSTVVGSREALGEYAKRGSWTLEEMFAYFDSLPEDTEQIYESLSSFTIANALLCDGYNYFMTGNRDFTSDAFTRCLERQKSLPFYYNDWKNTSPNSDIGLDNQLLFGAISAKRVALAHIYINYFPWLSDLKLYLSDEYCHIGYATDGDVGSRVNTEYFYAITSTASDKDICFELIKSFFDTDKYSDTVYLPSWDLPSLKSQFDTAVSTFNAEHDDEAERITDEELTRAHEIFDNAGNAYISRTSSAVSEIVEEEVSAYCSGMGNAESCGEKIRSRVEIWVAEHGD